MRFVKLINCSKFSSFSLLLVSHHSLITSNGHAKIVTTVDVCKSRHLVLSHGRSERRYELLHEVLLVCLDTLEVLDRIWLVKSSIRKGIDHVEVEIDGDVGQLVKDQDDFF